jgi:hypothetical protein
VVCLFPEGARAEVNGEGDAVYGGKNGGGKKENGECVTRSCRKGEV